MEKSGSFSQQTRITRKTGAETADSTNFNADLRQKMAADDAHYHAEKLGFGGHGTHEGWIQAEQAAAAKSPVNAESRQEMIAVAAYYLAEKRGFGGHCTHQDWIQAESEIDAKLHSRTGTP